MLVGRGCNSKMLSITVQVIGYLKRTTKLRDGQTNMRDIQSKLRQPRSR